MNEKTAAGGQKQGFFLRFLKLNFGLFLYGVGIVFTISANIGYSPWDVLNDGFARVLGISLGQSSIIQGVFFVLVVWLSGEAVGLGTVFNMILIGAHIDLIRGLGIINPGENYILRCLFFFIGLIIIAPATYEYISSGFGAGPRDALMVLITRRTPLSVGASRIILESTAAVTGYLLGGQFGAGTFIAAVLTGIFIQICFRLLGFDPTTVRHETLCDSLKNLKK